MKANFEGGGAISCQAGNTKYTLRPTNPSGFRTFVRVQGDGKTTETFIPEAIFEAVTELAVRGLLLDGIDSVVDWLFQKNRSI